MQCREGEGRGGEGDDQPVSDSSADTSHVPVMVMAFDLHKSIHRVTISADQDWETEFILWLEDQEKKNIGVEDGVFVVGSSIAYKGYMVTLPNYWTSL